MKPPRWLNPRTNPAGWSAVLGLAYATWQAITAAQAHGPLTWKQAGYIAAGVLWAAVSAYVRSHVTPVADPRDGNGKPLMPSTGLEVALQEWQKRPFAPPYPAASEGATMTTATPVKGCDYSASRPNLTQLKTAGIKFVVRYLSPGSNPKNLTKPELTALLAAGLHVCVVFESTAGRILAGHGAGAFDATVADEELKALNLVGLPVYFACDVDPRPFTTAQWTVAMAYLDGVASVIGHARTGGYGGLAFIGHAFDAKKIMYGWQTLAWSDGVWDQRAQLRQVKNGVPLAGGTVDLDEAYDADYGQYPRPVTDPGPFRHVVPAGNTLTLAKVAADRGTTVDHIAEVTTAAADPLHLAVFDEYLGLCRALRAVDLPRAVMPEGMVYWTTNP